MRSRRAAAIPLLSRKRRGGILVWLIGGLLFCAALGVLVWMVLLPSAVESRLAAVTGAQFRVRGLMGDPFAGRATATDWTLRASEDPASPVLARGGASEIVVADWRTALENVSGDGAATAAPVTVDRLNLVVLEAALAPDAKGAWPLLSLAAAAGLPYERGGAIGDGPRVRVKHLRLRVDTIIVRDAATGRDTPVRIDWRGEFRDLDHAKPVVTALFAAVRGEGR